MRRRLATLVSVGALMVAGAVATLSVGAPPAAADSPVQAATSGPTVHFAAAGDIGSTTTAGGVLAGMGAAAPDFDLALGDLSYGADGQEATWCNFVRSKVGPSTPFELIAGNHESNGENGYIDNFAACLPNRLTGLVGTYGKEWYVDVPASNPIMRIIMISPNLSFPGGKWNYTAGSSHYNWTANAIDGAHAANIPWVVVGMHEPCMAMTAANCSSGPDLNNLLVSKKVDLVLTGHVHMYARTKQLATSSACPTIVPNTSSGACIRDSDNTMTQGGTVFATVGTGGESQQTPNPSDPEAPYFAKYSSKAWGFLDVSADSGHLSASFDTTSGTPLSDSFTINRDGGSGGSPIAAFTSACTNLSCTFDGSGSSAAGGSITSYSWAFGDGGAATGATSSHTFGAAATYPVTLTVTDASGGTDAVTHQVSVTGGGGGSSGISFDGARSVTGGSTKSEQVPVPPGARTGDVLVVFFAGTGAWTGPTGVTGLTSLGTYSTGDNTSSAWTKVLSAADLGKTVRMDTSTYHKGVLDVAAYSGVDAANITARHTSDTKRAAHVGPQTTSVDGSWVLSYWSDKSAATTSWTAPSGVVVRDTAAGAGSGRYSSLLTDSGAAVPAGSYGPLTATASSTGTSAHAWAIDLPPAVQGGGGQAPPPVAAFTSACTALVCGFDGSGSTDSGGSISYAWAFGGDGTGTGATASHTFSAPGTYPVTLTVTDGAGQTGNVTHQVPVSSGGGGTGVSYVGAASITGGSVRSEQVPVPSGAQAGDLMVVFFAGTGTWTGPTGVTGLTSLGTFTTAADTSTAWTRVLSAADLGKTVRMDTTAYHKGVLSVAVYSGVDAAQVTATHSSDTQTATHTGPTITAAAGSMVLSYWSDKSPSTTAWAVPAGVTLRDTSTASTGSGRYSALLTDSGGGVPAGGYGPLTATTNGTSNSAHAWAIDLPAS